MPQNNDIALVVNYTIEALQIILLASLPSVITAAIVGVLISLLQALTQVQEQTLAFAFKLLGVVLVLYVTLSSVGGSFYLFTLRVFNAILPFTATPS